MKIKVVTGIVSLLLLSSLSILSSNVQTAYADQVFSDDFDDGDISDWTVTTSGNATFGVSTDTCVSSPYSVHMKSLSAYKAMGISPSYSLDLTANYTVSFYFRIPHTDNHWFEVFNNHQIYLLIDYDDDLKCYNGTSYLISELATNQWYHIEIKVHPSLGSYDIYLNGTFERLCPMWIHTGLENNFRIGDRADGSDDKGEAYWDDILIHQDITPPEIVVMSPQNTTYTSTSVPLTFTVNETTSWIGYSLNNQANVTAFGNTTLTGLSSGSYDIIVYANDSCGNTGSSNKVYFSVEASSEETVVDYVWSLLQHSVTSWNDNDPTFGTWFLNAESNLTFSPPDANGVVDICMPKQSVHVEPAYNPASNITGHSVLVTDGVGKMYTLNGTSDVDIISMTNDTGTFFWKDDAWHPAGEEWIGDGTPDPAGSAWFTFLRNQSIYLGNGTDGPLIGSFLGETWYTTGFSENTVVEPASRLNGFYLNATGIPFSSPYVGQIVTFVTTGAQLNIPWLGSALDMQLKTDQLMAEPPVATDSLFSPANLYITDPLNRSIGTLPNGTIVIDQISDAFYTGPSSEPERIIIPNPIDGTYEILITGTGNGTFAFMVDFAFSTNITERTKDVYYGSICEGGILKSKVIVSGENVTSFTPVSTIGDANQDGEVNILDIVFVAVRFDTSEENPTNPNVPQPYDPIADFNWDSEINILDIVYVAIHFRETV